tara:strand:- start:1805 stop:1909 length:105 start_codon:yes stop_codon:yes gene_type:complete
MLNHPNPNESQPVLDQTYPISETPEEHEELNLEI